MDRELALAAAEVDRTLMRWFLALSPLERLRSAASSSRTWSRFKRVPPKSS